MLLPEITVKEVICVSNDVSRKKTWSNPHRTVHLLGYQYSGCCIHQMLQILYGRCPDALHRK